MKTQTEFLKMLKAASRKAKGSKSDKQYAAWREVDSSVSKGEESAFDDAFMIFKGITKEQAAKKAKAATKRIDNAFNSKETQKHLKAMHGDSGFYSNIALD